MSCVHGVETMCHSFFSSSRSESCGRFTPQCEEALAAMDALAGGGGGRQTDREREILKGVGEFVGELVGELR